MQVTAVGVISLIPLSFYILSFVWHSMMDALHLILALILIVGTVCIDRLKGFHLLLLKM